MNIGIDARIAHYNASGLRRYLIGLISALVEQRGESRFVVYESWRARASLFAHARVRTRRLFTPPHFAFERSCLKFELRREKLDLLHFIDFFAPLVSRFPTVLTVHDLYFLREPDSVDSGSQNHYGKLLDVLPDAAHVICDSISTKKDLVDLCSVDPGKVTVVYPGADLRFARSDQAGIDSVKQAYALPKSYLLSVGTIEPRKNLATTLRAYRMVCDQLGASAPDFVLVGRRGYRAQHILSVIEALSLSARVRYLGEVADADLPALYRCAKGLVYTSLYEGFGFPILEAMCADIPVLTSNCSSMPEVAGNAALFSDPQSEESIAEGMMRLVDDEALRHSLVSLGRSRRAEFSWQRAAREVLAVYELAGG